MSARISPQPSRWGTCVTVHGVLRGLLAAVLIGGAMGVHSDRAASKQGLLHANNILEHALNPDSGTAGLLAIKQLLSHMKSSSRNETDGDDDDSQLSQHVHEDFKIMTEDIKKIIKDRSQKFIKGTFNQKRTRAIHLYHSVLECDHTYADYLNISFRDQARKIHKGLEVHKDLVADAGTKSHEYMECAASLMTVKEQNHTDCCNVDRLSISTLPCPSTILPNHPGAIGECDYSSESGETCATRAVSAMQAHALQFEDDYKKYTDAAQKCSKTNSDCQIKHFKCVELMDKAKLAIATGNKARAEIDVSFQVLADSAKAEAHEYLKCRNGTEQRYRKFKGASMKTMMTRQKEWDFDEELRCMVEDFLNEGAKRCAKRPLFPPKLNKRFPTRMHPPKVSTVKLRELKPVTSISKLWGNPTCATDRAVPSKAK